MPVTIYPTNLKYKNQNGTFQSATAIKGDSGVGVPSGGTAGQVLSKVSTTDYDTEWITPSGDVTDVQINGTSIISDGIANIPPAGKDTLGLVKVNGYGLALRTNDDSTKYSLTVAGASNADVKNSVSFFIPLIVRNRAGVAFWGLAEAAGDTTQQATSGTSDLGTYTETAKSKIHTMFNAPVTVTGSTPSIAALPGIQYICGEVLTLDVTLPASGIVDVVFESGSTPTVLTITPPTGVTEIKWVGDFDPDDLDADTRYEINIMDGEWGMVVSWT